MTDRFYRAFEERYRGSRELIKGRLKAYQPFLEPLLIAYPKAPALDLGCGRGEWLEYLKELGFSGRGVDLDEGMLSACVELGLKAEKSDALEYLKGVDSDSLSLVSAFHVVEHISFDDLRVLVAEALRVLVPGGLLIMETPNPENIVVATRNFYLDPTHRNPIPSELLGFVVEFTGFRRVKTIRLQESRELIGKQDISFTEVLCGVSPDYAIVAQKSAEAGILASFEGPFTADYGLSLETLSSRFDHRVNEVAARVLEAETSAREAASRAMTAEAKAIEAAAKATESEAQINSMLNSRSWRITAPLRALGRGFRAAQPSSKGWIKLALQHAFLYVQRRPTLKRLVVYIVNLFPGLKSRLVRISRLRSVGQNPYHHHVPLELENLTPHARRIYQRLKTAEEKNRNFR